MKLAFIFDAETVCYQGKYYAIHLTGEVWAQRYLPFFDEIVVVGRLAEAKEDPSDQMTRVDSDRVHFCPIPALSRGKRMLSQHQEGKWIEERIRDCDLAICRSWWGTAQCRKLRIPYMIEVVSCVWDSLWNHSALGKIAAVPAFLLQRRAIRQAPYVLYVTEQFLQKRYPTRGQQIGVSDVALFTHLSREAWQRRQQRILGSHSLILGTAAALDVSYKGQRFVLRALALLKKQGITRFRYELAGCGQASALEAEARALGVEELLIIRGSLPHARMEAWFDSLDLYIQPSLQEGLPRALVEAMSRGLPCIGTDTGGIPELLSPSWTVRRRGDLPRQIAELLQGLTPDTLAEAARRNLEKAGEYDSQALSRKRAAFFSRFVSENS